MAVYSFIPINWYKYLIIFRLFKIFQFLCLGSIVLLVCRWQENLWIMTQKIVFFNSCVVHIVTIIVHIVLHNDNLYSWRPWSSKKHLNNNLFSYSEQRIDYKTFISIQRLLCVFCLRLVTIFFFIPSIIFHLWI